MWVWTVFAGAIIAFAFIGIIAMRASNSKNHGQNSGSSYDNSYSSHEEVYERTAKKYIDAAEKGDAEAQFNLAQVYEFHESERYIYWLGQAAEQGYEKAIRTLANEYNYGNESAVPPIEKDFDKAIKYLKILADKGDIAAIKDISLLYAVELKNDEASRNWMQKAAELGDIEAMVELADDYRLLNGIADFDKAEYWYKKAADLGDGFAMKGIGDLYCYDETRHDYFKAEMWYKKAIAAENWFAYVRLGDMYREGKGFSKDYAMAFDCYKKAADKGDKFGIANMAECYLKGEGVERDEEKAVKILKEVTKNRFWHGEYLLGLCYFNGTGVVQDYKRAVEHFEKAEYEDEALNKLGECYYFGYGVKADKEKAHELWHEAAENECEDAVLNLKTYFYETVEPCDGHR